MLGTWDGEWWEGLGPHPVRSPISGLLVEGRPRVRRTDGRKLPGERFPGRAIIPRPLLCPPWPPELLASPRPLSGTGHVSPGHSCTSPLPREL